MLAWPPGPPDPQETPELDFKLTDEHLQAQRLVRDFCQKEVVLLIKEADCAQTMPPDPAAHGGAGDLGFCLPEKYGGQGFDYITLGLVCEELEALAARACAWPCRCISASTALALLQWGTEAQKERFLTSQARGEKYGMFGLTQPGAGSDVAGMASTARRDGGDYIINGEKMWISLASKAHHILWVARTNPELAGPARPALGVYDRDRPAGRDARRPARQTRRAGRLHGLGQLPGCARAGRPPAGRGGEGFKIAMSCLDNGRYTVGSGAVGLIRQVLLDASVRYAKTRQAFGKEIGKQQLVQQKIARMARDYEIGRLMYYQVGWLKNQGVRNTRETSLLKWFATDASFEAANEAIQVHGAYGYSDEYDVERYLRNARGAIIYEGTSEIHQLMQAGYALGYRQDGALRRELPAYDEQLWRS